MSIVEKTLDDLTKLNATVSKIQNEISKLEFDVMWKSNSTSNSSSNDSSTSIETLEALDERFVKEGEGLFIWDLKLEDVRETIKGRTDFRELHHDDYIAISYFLGIADDIFPDFENEVDPRKKFLNKLRRECRGLVFHKDPPHRVLSRRFHKFFNVNEREETKNVDLTKPFVVLEKLDGSMVCPFYSLGKLRYGTKNGVTDTGIIVERFLQRINPAKSKAFNQFSERCLSLGFSPIFEWCDPEAPIVLRYNESSLRIIAIRHIKTGKYVPYNSMVAEGLKFGLDSVKQWTLQMLNTSISDLHSNFDAFWKRIISQKDVEGFVIRFDDGQMYKLKTTWYFGLNKYLNHLKQGPERHRFECILGERYDDIKPFIGKLETECMNVFAKDLMNEVNKSAKRLNKVVLDFWNDPFIQTNNRQKLFAEKIIPQHVHGLILWKILRDIEKLSADKSLSNSQFEDSLAKETQESIVKYIMKTVQDGGKFEENRKSLLGGISWKEYKSKWKLTDWLNNRDDDS